MDKRFLTPGEVAKATVNTGIKKASMSVKSCILLGILAGIFIGIGGLANVIISQTLGGIDTGLAKFAGATVFPVGLMLVVVCGAELFTGNNLMTLAVMDKQIKLGEMLRNWVTVYISNIIGSLILVFLVYYSTTLSGDAAMKMISLAEAKASLSITECIFRGILCNIMVVLAVWMTTASNDIVSKIYSCWFPIMLFVLCGFEHSVANMFFLPMGVALGANITIIHVLSNIVFVTIGNILGGAVIIPAIYYSCYIKENKFVLEEVKK